ncbi:MAG: hypothetical protein HQ488_01130 [Parcubacteria group bacterium]|nr:hypothetical protein [Parcubacteria group bacterium]
MATTHSIAGSLIKEQFETRSRVGVEKLLREGIADGVDTNSLLKRLSVYLLDKNGDFMSAVRGLPGAAQVPHIATIAVAHVLEDTNLVDSLLPGNNSAALMGLRFALKTGLAGVIAGIGEGATSFLQSEVDGVVDQHVSPDNRIASGRTGRLDELLYIANDRFGLQRPLLMVRDPSTGEVQLTERGNPRVEDAEGMAFITMWEQVNPETVETKKTNAKGSGPPVVTVKKATPPWRRIWLSEYIAQLKSSPGTSVDAGLIAQLEKLVAPPKSSDWEEGYSDDTLLVQRAIAQSAPDMGPIMRTEMEEMWRSVRSRKPPMRLLNYHIGGTFASKITAEGKLSVGDLQVMIDAMDLHLRGDQKFATRVRKMFALGKDWFTDVDLTPKHLVALIGGTIGFSVPVFIWISYVSIGLMGLLIGLFAPSAPMGSPTFTIAMLSALVGSCIGWSCTWIFPVIEKICKPLFGDSVSPDWLSSLGRRINAFSLGLGAKLLTVMILMEFPMVAKVVIVAVGALGSFGDVFSLTEMKEDAKIRKLLLRGLWFGTWIFTATGIAVALGLGLTRGITGVLISGPAMFSVIAGVVGAVAATIGYFLFTTIIGQLLLLAIFVGLVAWKMTKLERVWDGSAFKIQEIAVWRPTLGGVAVLALVLILAAPFGAWWKTTIVSRGMESTFSWVQSWNDPEPASASAPVAEGTASGTSPAPIPPAKPPSAEQCASIATMFRPSSCK